MCVLLCFSDRTFRVIGLETGFDEFVNVTVPGIIEEQSGSVTRHLQKSHESFYIDNTKLLKVCFGVVYD